MKHKKLFAVHDIIMQIRKYFRKELKHGRAELEDVHVSIFWHFNQSEHAHASWKDNCSLPGLHHLPPYGSFSYKFPDPNSSRTGSPGEIFSGSTKPDAIAWGSFAMGTSSLLETSTDSVTSSAYATKLVGSLMNRNIKHNTETISSIFFLVNENFNLLKFASHPVPPLTRWCQSHCFRLLPAMFSHFF